MSIGLGNSRPTREREPDDLDAVPAFARRNEPVSLARPDSILVQVTHHRLTHARTELRLLHEFEHTEPGARTTFGRLGELLNGLGEVDLRLEPHRDLDIELRVSHFELRFSRVRRPRELDAHLSELLAALEKERLLRELLFDQLLQRLRVHGLRFRGLTF